MPSFRFGIRVYIVGKIDVAIIVVIVGILGWEAYDEGQKLFSVVKLGSMWLGLQKSLAIEIAVALIVQGFFHLFLFHGFFYYLGLWPQRIRETTNDIHTALMI